MKLFLKIAIILFLSLSLRSQTDDVYNGTPNKTDSIKKKKIRNNDWLEKVTYGSNFQLQFGTYTFIYLSPTIGYLPFQKLNIGAGLIYNYISINYGGSFGRYQQSIYGTHTYARYLVTEGFFVQGQYDRLFQPTIRSINGNDKFWIDYTLVGIGFRQPFGDKVALTTTIMYNVTPNSSSIYPSRFVIQFGFVGGF
jgi:hypothetical protein